MTETETLEEFYRHKFSDTPANIQSEIGDFNVFVVEDIMSPEGEVTVKYARREFYKISLITGSNLFHYADKTIKIEGTSLIFFNPQVPYRWESLSKENKGFFCIFRDAFFVEKLRNHIGDLPMFAIGGKPSYILNEKQREEVSAIFQKMIAEIGSDYRFKQDLLVSYVTELLHYALKMEPSETLYQHPNANSRITTIFSELLDRQFPIASQEDRFCLRSARDFAEKLYIHINHLNRAVKETTGKTTTHLISERIVSEAKVMLKHTDWNISEISYCLGFEEPAHFNNFFKKYTSTTPSLYRAS